MADFDDGYWYEAKGDELAERLVNTFDGEAKRDAEARRVRWFNAYSRYESRVTFSETDYVSGIFTEPDLYNVSRSAVDTAQAEIAARQRPKPMFLTSGATWREKRKAKKLDQYVEAHFHEAQGPRYADVWELGEDVFRDAEVTGTGVIKGVADKSEQRIRYERVPSYEIRVDPEEAARGNPQSWCHVFKMDLGKAIKMFAPGKTKRDIEVAGKLRAAALQRAAQSTRLSQQVEIYEAWHLPQGQDEPGTHVWCVRGALLEQEEFTDRGPPLAFVVWNKGVFGIWGVGLVEEGEQQHQDINETATKLNERYKLLACQYIFYVPGQIDTDELSKDGPVKFVPVTGGNGMPEIANPPPVTPAEVEALREKISRYYEFRGISQMNASAKKDPGVESGIALQTLDDIKSIRFMPKARAYELLYVQLGVIDVRLSRQLGSAIAKWPGKRFTKDIKWSDVDLEEDKYVCRVAPVSSMSRDPAQRLQLVEQLMQAQVISKDKYLELIGMPDLDSILQNEGAESQWVEKLVDRYLDAEDEAELAEMGGFVEPDGYLLNPMAALVTVAQHYFSAQLDDAPAQNLDWLRRFMRSLQRILEAAKKAAAPQPPAVPNLPGAPLQPPPGAPPMPPTM